MLFNHDGTTYSPRSLLGLELLGKLQRAVRVFGESLDEAELQLGGVGGGADVVWEGHILRSFLCTSEAIYDPPCFFTL